MGRRTQITKEMILETALRMLIRDGYPSITVKTLAAEIGCSTQPIVWHFDNMQGFRKAFLEYSIAYTKAQFTVWSDDLDEMLSQTASRYISLACRMPHLFRFVYVDNKDETKASKLVQALQLDNTKKIIRLLCEEKGLNEQQATSFLMNFEFYIHGIASYTASGFVNCREEEIIAMTNRAKDAFLAYEGVAG